MAQSKEKINLEKVTPKKKGKKSKYVNYLTKTTI